MTRDQAASIMRGAIVKVNPLWNMTEPKRRRHLPNVVTVEQVTHSANTATKTAFLVQTVKGSKIWVCASYFDR